MSSKTWRQESGLGCINYIHSVLSVGTCYPPCVCILAETLHGAKGFIECLAYVVSFIFVQLYCPTILI